MEKTVTLNNGVTIPKIGLGVWQSQSGAQAQGAIQYALEAGYRHIDTAMIYHNEEDVGRVINNSSISRGDIFITTKLWNTDHGYENTKKAFHSSLRRLNLEYVDMYLIHFPASPYIKETWRAMEELYKEGYIRALGVSNFHEQHLDYLLQEAEILPMINQVEYHPYLTQNSLINYCKKKNIHLEAWSPLGMGRFIKDSNLKDIAMAKGKSIPQIILRWDIENGIITLPKSVHKNYIYENIDIFDFELTSSEIEYINSLNKNHHTGTNPEKFVLSPNFQIND